MKRLLKIYSLKDEGDYYCMIIESVVNGQRTQAKEQFKAMPRENRKEFIKRLFNGTFEDSALSYSDVCDFIDLI